MGEDAVETEVRLQFTHHHNPAGARVQYFRTRRAAEVDFVLSVGREHWPIEVKASQQVDARDLKAPSAFADHARRVTQRIVVFLGA